MLLKMYSLILFLQITVSVYLKYNGLPSIIDLRRKLIMVVSPSPGQLQASRVKLLISWALGRDEET